MEVVFIPYSKQNKKLAVYFAEQCKLLAHEMKKNVEIVNSEDIVTISPKKINKLIGNTDLVIVLLDDAKQCATNLARTDPGKNIADWLNKLDDQCVLGIKNSFVTWNSSTTHTYFVNGRRNAAKKFETVTHYA